VDEDDASRACAGGRKYSRHCCCHHTAHCHGSDLHRPWATYFRISDPEGVSEGDGFLESKNEDRRHCSERRSNLQRKDIDHLKSMGLQQ